MAKIDENKLIITDEQGNEHNVEILFTYHHDERNKDYVFFTDPNDEEGVICMSYNEETGELFDLEDDEYDEVEEVFNAYQEDPEIQKLKD